MSYAKEIGTSLAEELFQLFQEEELHEIRDLKTLETHIASASAKYGKKHDKVKKLQALHQKKTAAERRKAERHERIQMRQEYHAARHGYKKGKNNTWTHKDGHTLTFGDGRSWHHTKKGQKKVHGGNATPIRDLANHLRKLHEGVDAAGQPIQEIRGLNRLNMALNKSLLSDDPMVRQQAQHTMMLKRRKALLGMGEAEGLCALCGQRQKPGEFCTCTRPTPVKSKTPGVADQPKKK